MTDERKEEIKLKTELLRYLVLAGLTTGGGSLGVIMGNPSEMKFSLAVAGLFCALTLILLSLTQYIRLAILLKSRNSMAITEVSLIAGLSFYAVAIWVAWKAVHHK